MAKISFRQGIVSHPKNSRSGLQSFLRKDGDNVDILIDTGSSITPITIAFAHQDTNYLYTESKSITSAWKKIRTGTDYWLFWDIDLNSGTISRDSTIYEPIYSRTEPDKKLRRKGQMWFDLTDITFKEWQGNVWRETVRVMAAKVANGTQFQSLSVNANKDSYTGTQVGTFSSQRGSINVGSLVYNKAGKAIKSGKRNQFFTTEDQFLTGVPTGASNKINNTLVTGVALCPLAAFQIVQYNDYNSICLANVYEQGSKLFGIVESDVETGEVTNFVSEGIIFNENWDWEALGVEVNTPLYIDQSTKRLTQVAPIGDDLPVGTVIGVKEVYFAPRLFPQVDVTSSSSSGLSPSQLSQLNDASTLSSNNKVLVDSHDELIAGLGNSAASFEEAITNIQIDLTKLLPFAGGSMTGPLTLSGPPTEDLHATTKAYVDKVTSGFDKLVKINEWVVVNDNGNIENQLVIKQATHGLPIGVYFNVVFFNEKGRRISIEYGVDKTTGDVTLYTEGSAFSGSVRIT